MDDKNEQKLNRIKELTALLAEAGRAYYQQDREIMSNLEYDRLYDELAALEQETGITLAGSPTVSVGYEVAEDLPKEAHEKRMLSLDKTKDPEALAEWLGEQKGVLSWKLDGLTIVLTYQDGGLVKAVTRGNGEIGEVITANARVFENLPLRIAYDGTLLLRGEAIIKYSDFEEINRQLNDPDAKYKNPRNLCSGSVRQLNSEITARRHVHFYAFSLVSAAGGAAGAPDFDNSRAAQFQWLTAQGFEVVDWKSVTAGDIEDAIADFAARLPQTDLPSDGLVLLYDDIAYGESLGNTAKFPRDAIAFKWRDERKATTLREIEWSASRTGLINPIAIFEPVELEGTTVSRASVHNVSIMRELELGVGDEIEVYKANMIIPQIAENLTRSGTAQPPDSCPVCGGPTKLRQENDVESLYCINEKCLAKQIKAFTHFVSRDAMNIEGLSEATIEKLIARGLIRELADLFHVEKYREEITAMEGFGEKSYANLAASIKKAKKAANPARLLYSLGIPGIGVSLARLICRACGNDMARIRALSAEELAQINGIGPVLAENFTAFFADPEKKQMVDDVLAELNFPAADQAAGSDDGGGSGAADGQSTGAPGRGDAAAALPLEGMTFVITGSLTQFKSRRELQELIEEQGGRSAGSVSAKTDYLINHDNLSNSAKNKAAKTLGVPILTEAEFLAMLEKNTERGGAPGITE